MEEVAGLVGESTSSWTGLCNWETKEDDEGSVVVDIDDLSMSTDAATLGGWLCAAASYWRSQGKKALRLKVPRVGDCDKILLQALEEGFTVHPLDSTHFMLALTFREKEHSSVPSNAVDQFQGDQHFGLNDIPEIIAEQSEPSLRRPSFKIPQWHTQGYRNLEAAAERGGTNAKINASGQPLELVANLPTSAMTDLSFNSDVAALLRCFDPLASLSPQQLLNSRSSLLPQWQTHGHRNSQAAETGGTSADNNPSVHFLELSANQAPSVMFDVGSASEVAALSAEQPSPSAQKQPVSDDVFHTSEPATETKRRSNDSQHHPTRQKKRFRSTNWSNDRKLYLLRNRLKYNLNQKHSVAGKPDSWFQFVSKLYLDEFGDEIEPRKWQDQMDSLRKQFRAICAYEEKIESGQSTGVSFWKLSEDERRDARTNWKYLPSSLFNQEMFYLMTRINETLKENKQENSRGHQAQVRDLRQSSSNLGMDLTISAGPSDGNKSSQENRHVLSISDIGSLEGIEGERVGLDVGNRLLKSTASTIDEKELIAMIGPPVKRWIDDALQPLLALNQKREEDMENYRQKKLALKAQQLAVMRQNIELTRNDVFANTHEALTGGVDPNVNSILEHGQDTLRSYFADEEPQEAYPNFGAWNHIPGQ